MAEIVDLIRDYSKEFILRPINEKFEKNEFYFNEKIEKMEKHFIQRLQQLEILIETNNNKTCLLDKSIETLQINQNKFEGKSEFILETNEKKIQQVESRLNDIGHKVDQKFNQPSTDLIEVEQKYKKLTESVKKSEIQCKELSENVESNKVNFSENLDKANEIIEQLQLKVETTEDVILQEIQTLELFQTKINNLEKQVKQINFQEELDTVIILTIKLSSRSFDEYHLRFRNCWLLGPYFSYTFLGKYSATLVKYRFFWLSSTVKITIG
ncbi:hypothetical protein CHUAL_008908 [Chamberlinius hualienensis]